MKIKIIQNGTIKKIIGTKYSQVCEKYIFLLIIYGKKYIIKVPPGFITDFGSIPPIFFMFDKSRYISYILHDFLYSLIGEITNINGFMEYDQGIADEILCAGLEEEGMSLSGRISVLIGLDIGGKYNYKKYNQEISDLKDNNS